MYIGSKKAVVGPVFLGRLLTNNIAAPSGQYYTTLGLSQSRSRMVAIRFLIVLFCPCSCIYFSIGLLATSFVKQQFKGLSVYVGVCGKSFLCLSTRSYCHNKLRKQRCGEDKHEKKQFFLNNGVFLGPKELCILKPCHVDKDNFTENSQ